MPDIKDFLPPPIVRIEHSGNPDGGELLSDLYNEIDYRHKFVLKSISHEAHLAEALLEIRPAYTAALKGDRFEAALRLGEFNRKVVHFVPFYDWARNLAIRLPGLGAEVMTVADPAVPIRNIMDELTGLMANIKLTRERFSKELPALESEYSVRLGAMLHRREKEKMR